MASFSTASHLHQSGKLKVLVAPTAAGKTTLAEMMVQAGHGQRKVTLTTRDPRPGEKDGIDYFFVTRELFLRREREGFFLEHATVHGNLYGTPKESVLSSLATGKNVILAIDIQGLRQIKAHREELVRNALLSVFIYASLPTIRRRLIARAAAKGKPIDPAELETRLATAETELKCIHECDASISNDVDGDERLAATFQALQRAINFRTRLAATPAEKRPWHQPRWQVRPAAAGTGAVVG